MSSLGYLSGRFDRQFTWFEEISAALTILRALSLGLSGEIKLPPGKETQARQTITQFVQALLDAFQGERKDEDADHIVERLSAEAEPIQDMVADLKECLANLEPGKLPKASHLDWLRQAADELQKEAAAILNRMSPR